MLWAPAISLLTSGYASSGGNVSFSSRRNLSSTSAFLNSAMSSAARRRCQAAPAEGARRRPPKVPGGAGLPLLEPKPSPQVFDLLSDLHVHPCFVFHGSSSRRLRSHPTPARAGAVLRRCAPVLCSRDATEEGHSF